MKLLTVFHFDLNDVRIHSRLIQSCVICEFMQRIA